MKRLTLFCAGFSAIGLINAPLSAASIEALAKKLAAGASTLENKKVAVLTFPYHDEKMSSGSSLVSERLTTALVERKEVHVLERNLMGELLQEKKLSETGIIDPRSLKTIGKALDSDAIITGTLIDLPYNLTEVNARLIRTDTGEVLAAGQAVVDRTWPDAPYDIAQRMKAIHRPAPEPNMDAEVTPIEELVQDDLPIKRLSNKQLKLSNESFPPDRRRYLSNEPSHPMPRNMMVSPQFWEDDAISPVRPFPVNYRSVHHGYNGTDDKPLPPPPTLYGSRYPVGSVRFERHTTTRSSSSTTK